MIIGKVTGSIVSTRKQDNLVGNKFMVIEPINVMDGERKQLVAIDNIGAGIGEYVLRAVQQELVVECRILLSMLLLSELWMISENWGNRLWTLLV